MYNEEDTAEQLMSTASKLLQKKQEEEKQRIKAIEDEAEFQKALNLCLKDANTLHVFDVLMRIFNVFGIDKSSNPAVMFESKVKREIYLKYIRPYLDDENRKRLEK